METNLQAQPDALQISRLDGAWPSRSRAAEVDRGKCADNYAAVIREPAGPLPPEPPVQASCTWGKWEAETPRPAVTDSCGGRPGEGSGNAEIKAAAGETTGGAESDESVLERLNAGEQRAMAELWGRYAGLLFSQALRVLHNPAEAEDIVAEVFSEVWRRASGYHPERARPVAWLVTLVRRRAIDRYRERRSLERAEERLALECGDGRESADGNGEQVRLAELRLVLDQALRRLPERQRETVCLVYFEGLTQREISKRTRTPIGTVKTRLELGLRKMRERIRGARFRLRDELGTQAGVSSNGADGGSSF
jgi:RNA polymerase sigma-70 factor (ECF subfamily)